MPRGIYPRSKEENDRISKLGIEHGVATRFKSGYDSRRKKGEENNMWKGDKAGYHALHSWVRRHKKPPTKCILCKKEGKVQAANISGEYKRDLSDWEYLCSACHVRKDGTINNLKYDSATQKRRAIAYWTKRKSLLAK